MRVLVTSFPAYGHFHPVAPLALALQAAGHEVRVATGPDLVDWVALSGLPATPVGLTLGEVRAAAAREHPGPDVTGHMFSDVWVGATLPGLLDLAEAWRPDLVVHEEEEYTAVLVAALSGVPCVTHSWSSPARPRVACERQEAWLGPLWEVRLPGTAARRVGELYLDACPPPFQTEDIDAIARTTRVLGVRPTAYDGPSTPPPALLVDLPRPAAYVTLGTVPVFSTPERLHDVATSVATVVASVVVTAGPNPVDSLGDLPESVHVLGYLPQSLVLPHVDLVVTHGGAGGTLGALAHGLPHLVMSGTGMSQDNIATAVTRLGVGISLEPGERDPASVAAACRRLLAEPSYALAARAVQRRLEELPGPADLVGVLESLAS